VESSLSSLWYRGLLPDSRGRGLLCTDDAFEAFEISNMKVKCVVQGDLDSDNLHLSGDGAGPTGNLRCKLAYKVGSGAVVVNWDSRIVILLSKALALFLGRSQTLDCKQYSEQRLGLPSWAFRP